jgi:uncharacterized membrane protein YbaN (DUF454 family)
VRRWLWLGGGFVAVGVGFVGVVVPGLPTTVFFVVAASCFARSSPRFERWVLGLPRIGPLVADHRAGLGMPRRAKVWALAMMAAFGGLGGLRLVDKSPPAAAGVATAVVLGAWYVWFRVPTRAHRPPVTESG